MMDDTKVPVVAVVGFLPASKEGNLLKHILTGEHGKRVAVVRYADCLGVDGAELERCKCSQCVVDGVDGYASADPPPSLGSRLVAVDGVRVGGLAFAGAAALLNREARPLRLGFL